MTDKQKKDLQVVAKAVREILKLHPEWTVFDIIKIIAKLSPPK